MISIIKFYFGFWKWFVLSGYQDSILICCDKKVKEILGSLIMERIMG